MICVHVLFREPTAHPTLQDVVVKIYTKVYPKGFVRKIGAKIGTPVHEIEEDVKRFYSWASEEPTTHVGHILHELLKKEIGHASSAR